MRTTPFHPRLAELSQTQMWGNWSGYLSAVRYDLSSKHEYFGVRNAAGFFDTSPLHKYWIRGRDAELFCSFVFARDVRTLKPGRAQYTIWCDDAGFIMEDGVLFRFSADEFMLTAAEPNFGFLTKLSSLYDVEIVDATEDYASLALQGPRSRDIFEVLTPDISVLRYFGFTETKIANTPVIISRTGFSGDLGYEVMIPTADALRVLDAILEAGHPHGIRPYGDEALGMTRIEAGLPLIELNSTPVVTPGPQRIASPPMNSASAGSLRALRMTVDRLLAARRSCVNGSMAPPGGARLASPWPGVTSMSSLSRAATLRCPMSCPLLGSQCSITPTAHALDTPRVLCIHQFFSVISASPESSRSTPRRVPTSTLSKR